MSSTQFIQALQDQTSFQLRNDTERVLWLAGEGKWDQAHDLVESLPEPQASWIHAHLHRQEGDKWNAQYWYQRAQRPMPNDSVSIQQEWQELVTALVK